MIKFIKVAGDSLSPEYKEGDYVMLITVSFFSLKCFAAYLLNKLRGFCRKTWVNAENSHHYSSVAFRHSLKRGDTIVFRHPEYGTMIKNIDSIDSDKIFVVGTHPHSTDSRQFGPIERGEVVGKVIWHIKKP